MNWGYKITITFILFGALIIFMVVKSFQQNIDLVTEDYYGEELKYQEQIEKMENVNALETKVTAKLTDLGVLISFPDHVPYEKISGKVQLYRPSQSAGDKFYDVALDTNYALTIKSSDLRPGKYLLKIDWSDGVKPYFQEISVFVPQL